MDNSFLQRCPADASAPPLDTPLSEAAAATLPNGAVHYFESFCIDRYDSLFDDDALV
jgi:hypothetical protein